MRASVANPDWALLPGMSVKAELALADNSADANASAALQVPADAVVRNSNGSSLVWVVRENAQGRVAQPVEVSLGRSAGNRIEIRARELKGGDLVVILGNESLKPGQPLIIESAG